MRALAWDDQPEKYMKDLVEELGPSGIEVTVCRLEREFRQEFQHPDKKWDFVITDLMTGDSGAISENDARTGVEIARRAVNSGLPVFMVTQHFTRFDPSALGIPPEVVIRSKSTDPGWQAGDIIEELRRRGLFTNPKRVFLIFGHDRTAEGTSAAIEQHLRKQHARVEKVTPDTLFTEINHGLVGRMHDCRAILAVFTPDDKVEAGKETYYQPRPNVLYEIGIALGLARGLERLTIIEKKGASPEQQVRMPSDLRGILPLRFEKSVDEIFDRLDARLLELGVHLG
jgi:hypothetical protein